MKKLYAMYSLLLCLGSAGFMHGAEEPEEPTAVQELIEAARNNDLEMVKKLIESGRVGVNDTDNGINALAAALLGQGDVHVFYRSQENWIAREPLIRYLVNQGANITISILRIAAADQSLNTLRMIFESPQVDGDLINRFVIEINKTVGHLERFEAMAGETMLFLQARDRVLKVWQAIQKERRQKLHEALESVEGVQSTGRIIPPIEALIQGYDE